MNTLIISLFLCVLLSSCSSLFLKRNPKLDLGPIISEVTQNKVILWGRTKEIGKIEIELFDSNKKLLREISIASKKSHDNTFSFEIDELRAGHIYFYKFKKEDKIYSFKTAHDPLKTSPLRIAWSGDLAGQNVCRDKDEGYIIFKTIEDQNPDLFIGLGDMIYADGLCKKVGRYGNNQIPGSFDKSFNLENFWKHWSYNRADNNFKNLTSKVPYLAVWDDHEVINDFGPMLDKGSELPYDKNTHLMPIGYKAFVDYNPISTKTLFRKFSWGKTVDIFILDTRQYRDPNPLADSKERRKTMLGHEQLKWLKKSLKSSSSQFKIIISSVPLSIPTGFPLRGDGWANFNTERGYENELLEIVDYLHKNNINQTVWLTTDVHFAEVFRYRPYMDDPEFELYEIAVGPLSAGLFPNKEYDTTLGPKRLFYYGADSFYNIKTYKDAKKWSNFGVLDFDGKKNMLLKIINTFGKEVFSLKISKK